MASIQQRSRPGFNSRRERSPTKSFGVLKSFNFLFHLFFFFFLHRLPASARSLTGPEWVPQHSYAASTCRWPFLAAHSVDETYGAPPFYSDHPDNDVSKLLFSKVSQLNSNADKSRFRVMITSVQGAGRFKTAYVTYAWATVVAHREVDMERDLPAEVPKGFEELRAEILGFGKGVVGQDRVVDDGRMGVYLVVTYDIRGLVGDRIPEP
jgi:hypothetical protein